MDASLSAEEKRLLLRLAREAIECALRREALPPLDSQSLTDRLLEPGASFVTLYSAGELRGCVGGTEPRVLLAQDVREHAIAAAFYDNRFLPLQAEELAGLQVEVSVLSPVQTLTYESPDDLLRRLRPGVDGVILTDGARRATFLPQVWEKAPDPAGFLELLCQKMGAPPDEWQSGQLEVRTYQVEKFLERDFT